MKSVCQKNSTWKCTWKLHFPPFPNHQCTNQNITDKFIDFDTNFSNWSEFYNRKPGLYPSNTDVVGPLSTFVGERHIHNKSSIRGNFWKQRCR